MTQFFESILSFVKDYSKGFTVWMKFVILKTLIVIITCYAFDIDVNKAVVSAFAKDVTEMYIAPEKVKEVDTILAAMVVNCGGEGGYIFAYLPIHAIQASTMLQGYEISGIDYLNYENYTNVPVTIDGEWFLKMKAKELYHRQLAVDGTYSNMYLRGVRHFYSYPVVGGDGVVYGNIMVAMGRTSQMPEAHIKEYMRVAADNIVRIVEK